MRVNHNKSILVTLILLLVSSVATLAQIDLSLRYSSTDNKYHVYLRPTSSPRGVTNPTLTDGSSIITIVATTGSLSIVNVTSINPSASWSLIDTQRNNGDVSTGAPVNTDFFVFAPSGDFTSVAYTSGTEVELFNFSRNGACTGSLNILSSGGQTAGGGLYNISSYYSVKGYAGSIGANHFSGTYNISVPCSANPDLITSIGQPSPALVAGLASSLPITVSNIGAESTTGPITVTLVVPATMQVPPTFTVGNFGCALTAGVVSCTSTTPIGAGGSTTVTIPLTPTVAAVGTTPTFTGGVSTPTDSNPANNSATPTTVSTPVQAGALAVRVVVLLQGASINSSASPLMRDDLRVGGYIPLTTPYSASVTSRFAQVGGGGETTTSSVLSANAGTANAIVDWVLVELRDAGNPAMVVATRSALVQRDGDVVSASDGVSPLSFSSLTGATYYVSVKHRNHLGVMTANATPLSASGTVVDFTTLSGTDTYDKPGMSVNYDGIEMVTINGKRALWAGNANHDNKVKYVGALDDNATIFSDVISVQSGSPSPNYNYDLAFGYFYGDLDMNGKAKYQGTATDTSIIFNNVLGIYPPNVQNGQLYNYDLFIEQLP